jgi:hypothetical protein
VASAFETRPRRKLRVFSNVSANPAVAIFRVNDLGMGFDSSFITLALSSALALLNATDI